MVDAGFWLDAFAGKRGSAIAHNAFGVRPIKRQTREELGGHAATPEAVVVAAAAARTRGLRLPQLPEQRRGFPHIVKSAVYQDVSGVESIVEGERAGVHVAEWVDEQRPPSGAA